MMKSLLSAGNRWVAGIQGSSASVVAGVRRLPLRHRLHRGAGFTLVELMIVVAIVAILTAIAYPSYTSYILKTRRSAAKACLSEYVNYMERYYTTNLTYAAAPNPGLDCQGNSQTGNYYDYSPGTPTASTYTLTATPKGAQSSDSCGALTLNQTGTRNAAGGAACW